MEKLTALSLPTGKKLPSAKQPKPQRSMTHPLRAPVANGARHRPKKGQPFDPEELTRRLDAYLAEEKIKAVRRRQARAAQASFAQKNAQKKYRHVPQVAAAAFERTATPDVLRKVHKLSEPALRTHFDVLSLDNDVYGQTPNQTHHFTSLQKNGALDQATLERDRLRNRNQFQWNHDMEEAAEVDLERDVYKLPQRTFNSGFASLTWSNGRRTKRVERPLSTGDAFWDEEEAELLPRAERVRSKTKAQFANDINDHRNDWAQRDDVSSIKRMQKIGAYMRKESTWILRGGRNKSPKDEVTSGSSGPGSPPDGSKTGKASFLARLKHSW